MEARRCGTAASGINSPLFFSGIKRMKYERMLEEERDVLAGMSLADVSDYLNALERSYVRRVGQLLPSCQRDLGVTEELKASDCGEWLRRSDQAERMARETALREMMDA